MKRRTRSDGFTLVEVLVSMTVMGLIATVISSVVIVAVKNNPAVQMRTDAALTLQGVTTWLPQDVDSTPPGGFDTAKATASGCGSDPGVNLLRMQWSEDIGGTVTKYIAAYQYVTTGTQSVIKRITCRAIGAQPPGNTVVQRASGPLAPMGPLSNWEPGSDPVIVLIDTDPDDGVLVTMTVVSENNQRLTVVAAPKNPANTLPPYQSEPTAPPVTTALATTTSTTTTTIPPVTTTTTIVGATTTSLVATTTSSTSTTSTTTTLPATTTTVAPCVITSTTMSDSSIKNVIPRGVGTNGNSAANPGVLQKSLLITVKTTGYCVGLVATPARGAPGGEPFRPFILFANNPTTYMVTFPGYPDGSPELWANGDRTITFSSPAGGPYGPGVILKVT